MAIRRPGDQVHWDALRIGGTVNGLEGSHCIRYSSAEVAKRRSTLHSLMRAAAMLAGAMAPAALPANERQAYASLLVVPEWICLDRLPRP